MVILGIDTSSQKGSIAITSKSELISETSVSDLNSYSKTFFLSIDSVLKGLSLSISEVDAIAVSIGPGSFTGLRVGLSTALGLSLATQKPIISVDTLLAMAHTQPITKDIICPTIDARKGELYLSFFQYDQNKQISRLGEDRAITPEALIKEIDKRTVFFGTGVDTYGEFISQKLGNLAVFNTCSLNTTAASVAKLGYDKIREGERAGSSYIKPKYIRRSEAEVKYC